MPGTFDERMAELEKMVPAGHVTAKVEVDQVYAAYQEFGDDFEHPQGGQAHYLGQPWLGATGRTMQTFADHLLEPDGLTEAGRQVALDGVTMVRDHAPVEFDNLRRSGHATVTTDGAVVFDEPPEVPRLSEAELKALNDHGHDLGTRP